MRIIYLDIDACRPDHLGCYGYPRPTSPTIDALAAAGARFTQCFTSDAPCLPSRAALFSARFGINNGITCHNGPASQMRYAGSGHAHDATRALWMRHFQTAGWETIGFSGFGQRHLAWWFYAGFTQNFGNQLPGGSEPADEVADKAVAWLDVNGTSDNWFMHVNFWDAHTPYRAPEEYYARMRGLPTLPHPTANEVAWDAEHVYGPRTARDWWISDPSFRNDQSGATARMPAGGPATWEDYLGFVDGYDAGIAFVDDQIARILAELDRLGIREETVIVVSADHGESIGELGMYFEHGNCCEGTSKVPLIINWPGNLDAGQVIDDLIYQLDLPPSLLELLGLDVPANWDGRSFAPTLTGEDYTPRDYLVLGTGIYSFQRAVRTQRHRLIRTIHSGLYPYDPLYLFEIETDPNQRVNLAAERPDVVAELDHLMLEWLWEHTTGPGGVTDPFQEQLNAGGDPDLYCPRPVIERRLTDLGRDDQLADLRHRRDVSRHPLPWHGGTTVDSTNVSEGTR
ncbi:MAG: sulfatase [Chloroflexia bacterium]|nr:sulfatase [Chloroflexia bacterium]